MDKIDKSHPYLLSREEWHKLREELRPDGASQHKYFKGSGGRLVQHVERLKYLCYGVHEWLYKKACDGCEDSLFKLDYCYDTYEEVLNKAREEGKI